VVNTTMPEVARHEIVPTDSVRIHYTNAQQVVDRLRALSVYDDNVVQKLEDEMAWDHLHERLASTLRSPPRHLTSRWMTAADWPPIPDSGDPSLST
jgi:predicted nucleotidyltransferase